MKILKYILCLSLYFTTLIIAQNKINNEQIKYLFNKISELQPSNDRKGIIKTLIEILKIDPDNQIAQNQLITGVRGYFSELVKDEEFLSQAVDCIKDKSKIPIVDLLAHYYSNNDSYKFHQTLMSLALVDTSSTYLSLDPLFEIDPNHNVQLFKEILNKIRPYVKYKEQSSYVFLNYLLDPKQDLKTLLYSLNIRLDVLELCTDSSKINQLRNLYFNKNPNPSLNVFNQIKTNLTDCLILNDPVLLSIYYYRNRLFEDLNKFTANTLMGNRNLRVDYRDLISIDPNLNKIEAKKLLRILTIHLPSQINYASFNDVELFKLSLILKFVGLEKKAQEVLSNLNLHNISLLVLYREKSFLELDNLLNQTKLDSEYLKIDKSELKNFDTEIDSFRAKKLFLFLSNYIEQQNYVNYQDDLLYEFAKICRSLNINSDKIFVELTNRINPNEYSYKKMIIWGVSCLNIDDEDRALRMFNNIINFGAASDLDYLIKELKWWKKNGLRPDLIENFLSKVNHPQKNANDSTLQIKPIESVTAENYFALLIGVASYQETQMNLLYPLNDIKRIKDVLLANYQFADKNIITLENPERSKIFETFQYLKKNLNINDNLLIFYAGHGYWDNNMQQGFWLPSDAMSNERTNWISNSEIVNLLKGIKANHTFLIADACFSGSIFITRNAFFKNDKSIELAYSRTSKTAMTSGADTPVPDKSVFVEFLIKRLKENQEKYLSAETLYLNFRDAVTNNSQTLQRPLYGELDGDEGGEFIFIKK